MARTALDTRNIPIDQLPPIKGEPGDREPDIVQAEDILTKDYADRLAFMEEPVTIRLEPSGAENAPTSHYVAVNGKGGEVLINGVWREMTYFPVGQILTTKRKYLAVLLGSKITSIKTEVLDRDSETPRNIENRLTSAVCNITLLEDRNSKGTAWLAELRRRNF